MTSCRSDERRSARASWAISLGLTIAALSLCAAASGCRKQTAVERTAGEPVAVPVAAVAAQRGSFRTVVHATGVVIPTDGAEFLVVAPEPARIVEITKAEGDMVTGGEALVRLDLPSATQTLARLRVELAAAQARQESARVAQTRMQDFVERGLVARQQLDTATRELDEAKAEVERAQAAHTAAETSVARSIIRAPFDGIVARRLRNPGDLVQAIVTDPILRIVDPRRLEVMATVQASDSSRVLPGASARVAGPDGRPLRLTVGSGSGTERPATDGSRTVRLGFAEPSSIAVDTRVDVEIDAEERRDAVFVPAEAVIREGQQAIVMVTSGGKAERRPVTIGVADEQRLEITSGVKAGELVITRGHVGLANGAAVSAAVDQR